MNQSINQSIILQLHGVLTTQVMSPANVTNQIKPSQYSTCPKGNPRSVHPTIPQLKIKKMISAQKGQTPRKPDPKREAGLPPNSLDSSCSLATHSYHNQFLSVPKSSILLHSGLASA